MKFFLTVLLSFALFGASAKKKDRITVASNGKTTKVELRYKSKSKKDVPTVLTVINAEGKVMSTENSKFVCGPNTICLCDALDLPDGTYTVQVATKKKTYTQSFIIWK